MKSISVVAVNLESLTGEPEGLCILNVRRTGTSRVSVAACW